MFMLFVKTKIKIYYANLYLWCFLIAIKFMSLLIMSKFNHIETKLHSLSRAGLRRCGHNAVLCETCCVLLCVFEQPWVDTSSAEPNCEQLAQLV
jgi:hypothetical protein